VGRRGDISFALSLKFFSANVCYDDELLLTAKNLEETMCIE
jgi:hypothetical protein